MKPTRLLIDADSFVYSAGRSFETVIDWGQSVVSAWCEIELAEHFIDKTISDLKWALGADLVTIALSGPSECNYRLKVDGEYKKNRTEKLRPVGYARLRDYLVQKYGAMCVDKLEADDIVGCLATQPCEERRIVVSIDKDLQTIPGELVNPEKLGDGIQVITEAHARRFFYTQILVGDTADNYKGCPSVGKVRAAKLLKECESHGDYWAVIVKAFEDQGLTEADAIRNARLARILQHGEYNSKSGEVKLWLPKK